ERSDMCGCFAGGELLILLPGGPHQRIVETTRGLPAEGRIGEQPAQICELRPGDLDQRPERHPAVVRRADAPGLPVEVVQGTEDHGGGQTRGAAAQRVHAGNTSTGRRIKYDYPIDVFNRYAIGYLVDQVCLRVEDDPAVAALEVGKDVRREQSRLADPAWPD